MRIFIFAAGLIACTLTFSSARAHESDGGAETTSTADDHMPIGVMGDHTHDKGEWMFSYRYMHMSMSGNRKGTEGVDAATIATTEANRFFGMPGQPPTLRVVPTEMTMDMHMLGVMHAPADWLTLMAMGMWQEKSMDHLTFAGGMGTDVLGKFTAKSEGWGDTNLSALIRLYQDDVHHLHLNAGVSLPTGSIDEQAAVLAPNGATPRLRMPYAMQLGTGTYDLLPGLTYYGDRGPWAWGAQYSAEIRLQDDNDEGYAWGDKHQLTAFGSYEWAQWISTSLRLIGTTQDSLEGIDPQIMAPVQTADPNNYGGDVLALAFGVNLLGVKGPLTDHRVAIEATAPFYRDLNGPQLETDWTVTVGWQYAF